MEISLQDLLSHAESSGEVPTVPGQIPTCPCVMKKGHLCYLNAFSSEFSDNTGMVSLVVLLFPLKYLIFTGTPWGGSMG